MSRRNTVPSSSDLELPDPENEGIHWEIPNGRALHPRTLETS
jgi:hypothetical protein